jgi:DNA-binding IclR family transcriptional regulator
MTSPIPPASTRAPEIGVRERRPRTLPSLTAARALRALEVLVFHAASPPRLAATMGIHDRTARRLLHALEDQGYVQHGHGNNRQRTIYEPTPRLLSLAGQLAERLPLVTRGASAAHQLSQATGLDAYLVVPSYGDVMVLARAGDHAPTLWSLLPASESAGGTVLLAYRQSWRDAQRPADDHIASLDFEARAAEIRRDGYALDSQDNVTSLAVPVPMDPAPLASLVLCSDTHTLGDDDLDALLTALRGAAEQLDDPPPSAPSR